MLCFVLSLSPSVNYVYSENKIFVDLYYCISYIVFKVTNFLGSTVEASPENFTTVEALPKVDPVSITTIYNLYVSLISKLLIA